MMGVDRQTMAEYMDKIYDNKVSTFLTQNRSFDNEIVSLKTIGEITKSITESEYKVVQYDIWETIAQLMSVANGYTGLSYDDFYRDHLHSLREQGQDEYARKNANAFANFERIAEMQGISREKVLLVYLTKHFDGIVSWFEGNKDQREGLLDRIGDACVYLFLLSGMVKERCESKTEQKDYKVGGTI
jgi:uncharacterized protein with HEPN domain